MAARSPIVIIAGQPQQLPSGDTLSVPQTGGDVAVLTNDEATPVVIGAPVYLDAVDGFKKAQANASGTRRVIGLVSKDPSIANGTTGTVTIGGVITATTAQWDAVAGTTGGLAFGVPYFLDPATAGKLTSTAPTTVGQYVVEVGVGVSTTELNVRIQKDYLL
jgi:hypothetical protein